MFAFGLALLIIAVGLVIGRLAYAVVPGVLRKIARSVDPVGWNQAEED